eukprot:5003123-Prymnesium_polylepis.1
MKKQPTGGGTGGAGTPRKESPRGNKPAKSASTAKLGIASFRNKLGGKAAAADGDGKDKGKAKPVEKEKTAKDKTDKAVKEKPKSEKEKEKDRVAAAAAERNAAYNTLRLAVEACAQQLGGAADDAKPEPLKAVVTACEGALAKVEALEPETFKDGKPKPPSAAEEALVEGSREAIGRCQEAVAAVEARLEQQKTEQKALEEEKRKLVARVAELRGLAGRAPLDAGADEIKAAIDAAEAEGLPAVDVAYAKEALKAKSEFVRKLTDASVHLGKATEMGLGDMGGLE